MTVAVHDHYSTDKLIPPVILPIGPLALNSSVSQHEIIALGVMSVSNDARSGSVRGFRSIVSLQKCQKLKIIVRFSILSDLASSLPTSSAGLRYMLSRLRGYLWLATTYDHFIVPGIIHVIWVPFEGQRRLLRELSGVWRRA